jgi:hypothetical protein
VVLPAALVAQGETQRLRWVLEHEGTHLLRRDAWGGVVLGLAQGLYFFLPWFWSLWRQVRLCQEYLADAAAARSADSRVDYAEFLLQWTAAGSVPLGGVPTGAAGVAESKSDLFRRVEMLVKTDAGLERRCPWRWSLAVGSGMLALAVLGAGVALTSARAEGTGQEARKETTAQAKPEAKKQDPGKAEQKKAPDGVVDLERFFDGFGPGAMDAQGLKELHARMEEARREMERAMQELGNLPPGAGRRFGAVVPGRSVKREEPRLGVQVEKPSAELVDQLDLPKDQGLVVREVGPTSAAAKAGLRQHDVLLELAGQPVPSKPDEFAKMLSAIKPNKPVDVVVLRKGKRETVKGLSLPEARVDRRPEAEEPGELPALPALPDPNLRMPVFPNFPAVPGVRGRFAFPPGLPGVTMMSRTNGQFTTEHESNGVKITLKGKIDEGKAVVTEVRIQADGQEKTYDSVDKVPAEYKDKVKKLLEMNENGGVRARRNRP